MIGVSILLVFGFMYEMLPFDGYERTEDGSQVYAWGPIRKRPTRRPRRRRRWARYNWLGYEGATAYPAYHDVVTTMDDIGEDRGCGVRCGRTIGDNSEYGTTMALMLLPHWTDGCIGSMEGLFFEATGTTQYHFITAAAVSESRRTRSASCATPTTMPSVGVRHMRDLGVRYLMVRTDAAKAEAAAPTGLEFVASSAPWDIYEVEGVEHRRAADRRARRGRSADDDGKPGDQRERNLELGTSWFQNRDDWPAIPVDDGPEEWQRVTAVDRRRPSGRAVRRPASARSTTSRPTEAIEPVALPEVTVSDVEIRQQSVEFSVDQVGVPVIVKVSYFPNWQVDGRRGPYRAGAEPHGRRPDEHRGHAHLRPRSALDWFFYPAHGDRHRAVLRLAPPRRVVHADVRRCSAGRCATTPPATGDAADDPTTGASDRLGAGRRRRRSADPPAGDRSVPVEAPDAADPPPDLARPDRSGLRGRRSPEPARRRDDRPIG